MTPKNRTENYILKYGKVPLLNLKWKTPTVNREKTPNNNVSPLGAFAGYNSLNLLGTFNLKAPNIFNRKVQPYKPLRELLNTKKRMQVKMNSSKIIQNLEKYISIEYPLESFSRSNQDTCLVHKPSVFEGQWVQSGDLLADCSASVGGELALGQNLLIGYMPWEGYNFEDAILISERLVYDDLYTSIHIERYEVEIQETKLGVEEITREIPDVQEEALKHLNSFGIAKLGSWVQEGDILVGKVTPINKKNQSNYQKLLYLILEKKIAPVRDSSLRAPKGIKAKVIGIQLFKNNPNFILSKEKNAKLTGLNKTDKNSFKNSSLLQKKRDLSNSHHNSNLFLNPYKNHLSLKLGSDLSTTKKMNSFSLNLYNQNSLFKKERSQNLWFTISNGKGLEILKKKKLLPLGAVKSMKPASWDLKKKAWLRISQQNMKSIINDVVTIPGFKTYGNSYLQKRFKPLSQSLTSKKRLKEVSSIQVFLAERRRVQVGDKMAGRHGNKGIISQILPIEDLPFLPDGTPLDMVLNPLGVPSRMNVGQIYECLLGLAGKHLGENFKVFPFDEIYGAEASRSFVYSKLYTASFKTGKTWLFNPNLPGKLCLYDGRTGESFDQGVTVGYAYILRLVHMVDDKIHCRSTGPYSLVTQQPLRGRSKHGGQRLGEMEVWALEGYGAAFTLLEMLTIKSDDISGRMTLWSNLILNKEISIGTPESFKVLICELQALCLDIGLFRPTQ
jgi:DNA-directed RNA polymerase subunit beta